MIENDFKFRYCPRCMDNDQYRLGDGRYKCKQCNHKFSIRSLKIRYQLLHYFSLEIPANKASKDLGMAYKTVRKHYMSFREQIYLFLNAEFEKLSGEIECDESYFGGKRKGTRGRGAGHKIKVLGLLERNGRIVTTIIENVSANTLMQEITRHAQKGSVFYTDQFKSYTSLKFYGKHLPIDHGKEFTKGRRHINGLEGFWSFAKERLLKYHGVSQKHFYLYLKEMEFRYNYRHQNLFNLLTEIHFGPDFT